MAEGSIGLYAYPMKPSIGAPSTTQHAVLVKDLEVDALLLPRGSKGPSTEVLGPKNTLPTVALGAC